MTSNTQKKKGRDYYRALQVHCRALCNRVIYPARNITGKLCFSDREYIETHMKQKFFLTGRLLEDGSLEELPYVTSTWQRVA